MKKNSYLSVRSRCWSLVLYDDPSVTFCSFLSLCSHYVYIFHDKDLNKQGLPKEPHYHLLCVLPNAKTLSAILSYHSTDTNVLGEPIRDKYKAYRYLRHLDNPDKFRYPYESLISDDLSYWDKLDPNIVTTDDGERVLTMLEDILSHKPYRELVLLYGRDLVKNFTTYKEFAIMLRQDDFERSKTSAPLVPLPVDLFELSNMRDKNGDLPF